MEKLLINKADINDLYNIGHNMNDGRVDPHIKRAQIGDLEPILGAPLYRDFVGAAIYPSLGNIFLFGAPTDETGVIPGELTQTVKMTIAGSLARVIFIPPATVPEPDSYIAKATLRAVNIDGTPGEVLTEGTLKFGENPFNPGAPAYVATYEYDFIKDTMYAFGYEFTVVEPGTWTPDFQTAAPALPDGKLFRRDTFSGDFLELAGLMHFTLVEVRDATGAITFTDPKYNTLFYGGDYERNNKTIYFRGVRPMLIGYAYSRLVGNNQTHVTRGGVTKKVTEQSEAQTEAEVLQLGRNAYSDALLLKAELVEFLDENRTTYDLYEGGDPGDNRLTSLNITRSPGRRSIKQY